MIKMDESVLIKLKRKNKILFDRNSECLEPLFELICRQNHRAIVLWAFDCAKETCAFVEEKYPHELRLRNALEMSEKWARGEIKMPQAKCSILDAHKAARDKDIVYDSLCHAVGQACSAVHTEAHAVGLPFYELSAIVHLYGIEKCEKYVDAKIEFYIQKMLFWQENEPLVNQPWAKFLQRNDVPNKELLIREKMNKTNDFSV